MNNNEWQPVETNPTDETQFQFYCGDEWGWIVVGQYGELITCDKYTRDEEIEICSQCGLEKPKHPKN